MNKPSLKALEKLLLSSAGQQPSSVGRLQDYRLIEEEGIPPRSERFYCEEGYRFGFKTTSRNSVDVFFFFGNWGCFQCYCIPPQLNNTVNPHLQ